MDISYGGGGILAERKHPFFRKKTMAVFLACAVCATAFAGGYAAWQSRRETTPEPAVTSRLVSEQLVALQQLVTVKYLYTGVGKFENAKEFYGYPVPFTTKSFLITYEGEILAGVDLAAATCDASGDTLTIILPKAKMLAHTIREDTMQVYDESASLFNPIHVSDYTAFCMGEKEKNEIRAVEAGLLGQAEEQARQAVSGALLSALPMLRGITITFAQAGQTG